MSNSDQSGSAKTSGQQSGSDPTTRTIQLDRGQLRLHTSVAGSAARMGHNLVIEVVQWQATVTVIDTPAGVEPVGLELTASLPSIRVVSGSGGVRPVSAADREAIVGNALKALRAQEFPDVHYVADAISATADGFALSGTLTIAGHSQPFSLAAQLSADARHVECATEVLQGDFGIKPYSTLMGQLRVADAVAVTFAADLPNPPL